MNMNTASGYYMNVYEDYGREVFVLLNEANGEPTDAEVIALQCIVEEELKKGTSIEELQLAIENINIDCVKYGVQIFLSHVKSNTLLRV